MVPGSTILFVTLSWLNSTVCVCVGGGGVDLTLAEESSSLFGRGKITLDDYGVKKGPSRTPILRGGNCFGDPMDFAVYCSRD